MIKLKYLLVLSLAILTVFTSCEKDEENDSIKHSDNLEQINAMNEYTPIVADLIDNFNQQAIYGGNRPIDNVNGYTLNQIQTALDNCRDINCWYNKLNNVRPTGVTTNELNQLFDYVRDVRNNNLSISCN